MTLSDFERTVRSAGIPAVYHETAVDTPGRCYVVWQEYYARKQAGGVLLAQLIQLDFYTKTELDPLLDTLLSTLEEAGVFYDEPISSYEKTTGYARHRIECEIIGSTKERMK